MRVGIESGAEGEEGKGLGGMGIPSSREAKGGGMN